VVPAILHSKVHFALEKTTQSALTILIIWTIIVQPTQAFSLPPIALEPLFQKAAEAANVPVELAQAIAKVESGLNPWALNIEGKSYVFSSKELALEKAKDALAAGQSFDSGVMQVNNRWLEKWRIPVEEAFDPATNIHLGSRILKQEIDRHGLTWNAIGAYHSPNDARQQKYIAKVKAALDPSATITPLHIESRQTEAAAALAVERRGQPLVDRQQPAGAIFVQRLGDRQNLPAASQSESGFIQRFKRS